MNSLHILDISPLLDVGLVKIFFQSVGCCFVLLTASFGLQKLCNFMNFMDGFGFSVKDQIWVYFWVFNSIPLSYLPISVPILCDFYQYCSVVQFKVSDSPRSSFIVENSFHYPGFLLSPDVSFYLC